MEREQFRVIPGLRGNSKITLIFAMTLIAALFLSVYGISEILLIVRNMDLAFYDLRRMLKQRLSEDRASSFTVTVSPIPETARKAASAPMDPTPMQTENI